MSTYANGRVCGQVGGLVDALATHKQHLDLSTMLVVEYRIALPLSLEEYRVAQRYMVDRNTRDKGAHAPRIDVRLLAFLFSDVRSVTDRILICRSLSVSRTPMVQEGAGSTHARCSMWGRASQHGCVHSSPRTR